MNNIPANHVEQQKEHCDPTMRAVGSVGTALFIFGIFVPGAHSLMMVGLALIAISYVV